MKKKSLVYLMTMAVLLGGCGGASSSGSAKASDVSQEVGQSQAQESQAQESQADSMPKVSAVMPQEEDAADSKAPVDADSWELIKQYGFQEDFSDRGNVGQWSLLSYGLKSAGLKDEGEYFTVDATFLKPVTVSPDLKMGDTVTVTMDELTGETETLTYAREGILTGENGAEYYYHPENDDWKLNGEVILYQDSDDRVDAPFYEGRLCISKDAVTGVALDPTPYETVSKDTFSGEDRWFNGVFFDDSGVVMELIYYGD